MWILKLWMKRNCIELNIPSKVKRSQITIVHKLEQWREEGVGNFSFHQVESSRKEKGNISVIQDSHRLLFLCVRKSAPETACID